MERMWTLTICCQMQQRCREQRTKSQKKTIYLWSDNYVHRNFVGVTLHFQKELRLYDLILGLKPMDFQRSTSANILS